MSFKHHIHRYSGFIKINGRGVVLPPSLRSNIYTKNKELYKSHNKKLLEGQGVVAHHHEMGGTVLHNHKHSTKETMEHKKQRHINPIKFNFKNL